MEKRTTAFACVFVGAIGASMYVGYRYRDLVVKALVGHRAADVVVEHEDKAHLVDEEAQIASPSSTDSCVQVSPVSVDAEVQTDEPCRDFEDITGEEIPTVHVPPNGWLERIWG